MQSAQVPTIFVSVAAFCEPHLQMTIHQLFAKAAKPNRIFVGLVDQSEDLNPKWLLDFPGRKHINYVGLSPVDSRGVSWGPLNRLFFVQRSNLFASDRFPHLV
jgi:hypothetical protein